MIRKNFMPYQYVDIRIKPNSQAISLPKLGEEQLTKIVGSGRAFHDQGIKVLADFVY